jgi:hypothetical protein
MSDNMTIEEAADRLDAIARARRAQDAVVEIAGRMEIAKRLEKASGLEGLQALAPDEVSDQPQGAVSGAAVLRALGEMCRDAR